MSRGNGIDIVWLVGALVLVGAPLINRGVGGRRLLVMALAWAGIIAGVVLIARLFGMT